MGISLVLCTVSSRRRAIIEDDVNVVSELLMARLDQDIPGLLDLDEKWDALSRVLGEPEVMRQAITGKPGTRLPVDLGFGPPRLIPPDAVVRIAEALEALPADHVEQRFGRLSAPPAHGNYGAESRSPTELAQDLEVLTEAFEELRELYRAAADDGMSMLVAYV